MGFRIPLSMTAWSLLTSAFVMSCTSSGTSGTHDGDASKAGDGSSASGGAGSVTDGSSAAGDSDKDASGDGSSESGGSSSDGNGGASAGGKGGVSAGGKGGVSAGGKGGASTGGKAGSSGGTSGAGGAKGTGGNPGPPPVPVTCTPDLGTVGVWQNISPPELTTPSNMEALSVVVDPQDGTVYAAGGNKTDGGDSGTSVLKSSDCGGSFALVNTGRSKDNLQTGDPWALLINKDDPSIIYINNGYGKNPTIYRSKNGGVDFDPLNVDPDKATQLEFVQAIAMEPNDPNHLAVTFHENCAGSYNKVCFSTSTDGGDTWHMFNGPAALTGWQEAASMTVIGPNSYLYAGGGAWFTSDGGKSWSEPITSSIFGSYGGGAILASDGNLYLGVQNNGVYQSTGTPLGATWKKLANSPQASVMTTDGTTLFASFTADTSGTPFYSAPISNPTTWTKMNSTNCGRGPNMFGYDPIHHIIYAANWFVGLWRVVLK